MKVYISGKITGLNFEQTRAKFQASSDLIESIGMIPVNPMENGLPDNATWEQHMLRDIEMLMGCQAIFMLDDWMDSRGARIEKFIAEQRNMLIFFESNIQKENQIVKMVGEAVTAATRIPYVSLSGIGKLRMQYFARMIFAKFLLDYDAISVEEVSRFLGRNEYTIMRYIRNYNTEYIVNKKFRCIAEKVELLLINNVSQ